MVRLNCELLIPAQLLPDDLAKASCQAFNVVRCHDAKRTGLRQIFVAPFFQIALSQKLYPHHETPSVILRRKCHKTTHKEEGRHSPPRPVRCGNLSRPKIADAMTLRQEQTVEAWRYFGRFFIENASWATNLRALNKAIARAGNDSPPSARTVLGISGQPD